MSFSPRQRVLRGACALLVLFLARAASAQATLIKGDDFESGNLSNWGVDVNPGVTVQASPSAAHSGGFGMQVLDAQSTGMFSTQTNAIVASFPAVAPAIYVRAWFRLSGFTDSGGSVFFQVQGNTPIGTVAEVQFSAPAFGLHLRTFDQANTFRFTDPTQPLTPDVWTLLELGVTGLGTPAGTAQLYRDGVGVGTVSPVDWTGIQVSTLFVGEVYTDTLLMGETDADEVRASPTPNATRLTLSAPATVVVGACVPVVAGLADVLGASTASPLRTALTLSASGAPGAYYSDSGCTTALAAAELPQGASAATVYFRGNTEGTATLAVQNPDFLPGSTQLTAVKPPPTQPPPQPPPGRYAVGCSCGSASPSGAGWSLATFAFAVSCLRSRRRRSRRMKLSVGRSGPPCRGMKEKT